MTIQYFCKKCNLQEKSKLKELIEARVKSMNRILGSSPENLLEVRMEKTAKKSAYIVELTLRSGGKQFVSREDDHTVHEAVDLAWKELMGQVRKLKLKRGVKSPIQFRGRAAKDAARYDELEQVEDISSYSKKEFFALVERYVARAREYVVSEIRFLEKTGELPEGALEADELVNDIVLTLWKNRAQLRISMNNFLSLFYAEALRALNNAKTQAADDSRPASLDSRVASRVGEDEERDFWQPDDIVTLADTLSFPKEKSRYAELRSLVLRELHHLPRLVRQEFNLVYQSGLTLREVAGIVKRSPDEVEKDIQGAVSMLRKKFAKLHIF